MGANRKTAFRLIMMNRAFLALILVGGAVACGAPETAAQTAEPTAAKDYCETIVDDFCDFYMRCDRMVASGIEECHSRFLESCNGRYEPRYVQLADANLLEFSDVGWALCAQHLSTVECALQPRDIYGPCADIWQGKQEVGGSCSYDIESFVCETGTACSIGPSLCGECKLTSGVDEICGDGAHTCGDKLYCQSGTCHAYVALNQACTSESRCELGASCNGATCQGPSYVGLGQSCDSTNRCGYFSYCLEGYCRPMVGIGENCSSASPCATGFCIDAVCEEFLASGVECREHLECATGRCIGGTCASLPSACF